MEKNWEAEFSRRFARHEDELKWLYGELYHGDAQAYDYFVSMLYRAYCERPEALRELDRSTKRILAGTKGTRWSAC